MPIDHTTASECRQAWNSLQQSKILDIFQRPEIPSRLCGHPPPDFSAEFFVPSYASNGENDSIDLRSILRTEEKFLSFTNESMRQTCADLKLLVECHKTGNWHFAAAAWHVGLLPEGHLVQDITTDAIYLVLKVPFVTRSIP